MYPGTPIYSCTQVHLYIFPCTQVHLYIHVPRYNYILEKMPIEANRLMRIKNLTNLANILGQDLRIGADPQHNLFKVGTYYQRNQPLDNQRLQGPRCHDLKTKEYYQVCKYKKGLKIKITKKTLKSTNMQLLKYGA